MSGQSFLQRCLTSWMSHIGRRCNGGMHVELGLCTFTGVQRQQQQRRSINRRRWLLLLSCIETLDSAASRFDFGTVGIKEIIVQGALGHAPWSWHRLRSCWVYASINFLGHIVGEAVSGRLLVWSEHYASQCQGRRSGVQTPSRAASTT